MIWFFLAGFVSGWFGMMLFARWWVCTHAQPVTLEELEALKKKGAEAQDD